MMTAEQRYRQAIQKARILARRELRQFMAGEIAILPCSGDHEQRFIIQAIQRAYDDGAQSTGERRK